MSCTRPEQPYVGIRAAVTLETIGRVADRIGELVGWLAARGAAAGRVPRSCATGSSTWSGASTSRPACRSAGRSTATADVTVGTLPAGRYAVVTHHGHPDELIGATAALLAWATSRA